MFQGFRSTSVGTDLISYIPDYSAIGRQGFTQLSYMNYEVGYVLLNKILYVLGLDERGFLIAIAVIIQVPIFYTLYSYSESPIISILWYFTFGNFIMTFSGLRQGIAIAICFVAYIFIRKKKIVFFVLTVLLAATFHSSALFCMLLYPMYQIKMNQRNFTISIFIFIGMYMF
ncbi:MAG: EpsG family protein, partial [Tannerellaceae bacterium]|nr:EpsG family protein [Tannerellaceae bacterium]